MTLMNLQKFWAIIVTEMTFGEIPSGPKAHEIVSPFYPCDMPFFPSDIAHREMATLRGTVSEGHDPCIACENRIAQKVQHRGSLISVH